NAGSFACRGPPAGAYSPAGTSSAAVMVVSGSEIVASCAHATGAPAAVSEVPRRLPTVAIAIASERASMPRLHIKAQCHRRRVVYLAPGENGIIVQILR